MNWGDLGFACAVGAYTATVVTFLAHGFANSVEYDD